MGKYLLVFLLVTSPLVLQPYELVIDTIETPQQAGVPFPLRIRLVDAAGNPAPVTMDYSLHLLIPEPHHDLLYPNRIRLINGVWEDSLIIYYAGDGLSILAGFGMMWQDTSNTFQVLRGDFERFQVLLPGESPDPGNIGRRGRRGTPHTATAGDMLVVTVYTTDYYWNPVDISDIGVTVSSTDEFVPAVSGDIVNGICTLQIIARAAGWHNLFAEGDAITPDTSTEFLVVPGEYKKLLVLVPPQEHIPGSPMGFDRRIILEKWFTGIERYVDVYTTDLYYNQVDTTIEDLVLRETGEDTTMTIRIVEGHAQCTLIFHSPGWKTLSVTDRDITGHSLPFEVIDFTPPEVFAYPNPMRDNTTIVFSRGEDVTEIAIYDAFGYYVWGTTEPQLKPWIVKDRHYIGWNGKTEGGVPVANGIYTVRVRFIDGGEETILGMSLGVMR